jgi:hypothetical protein
MGITDFFSDVWETFSHPSPDAEAPPQGGSSTQSPASGTDEESKEEAEVNKEDEVSAGEGEQGHRPSDKGDDDDEDEAEDEEEEDEDEIVDPKETLEKGEFTFDIFAWRVDGLTGGAAMGDGIVWMGLHARLRSPAIRTALAT